MSDAPSSSYANPWRSLWFRPRVAIEAALAQGQSATPLLIALTAALFSLIAAFPDKAALFASSREPATLATLAAVAAAIIVLATLGYYLNGWLLNAAAHLIAGRGSAAATRAAAAWSSVPLLAADLVALAFAWVSAGQAARPGWSVAISAGQLMASLWSLALVIAMLGRVQGFGKFRAFVAFLTGSIAPALLVALLVRVFLFQPFSTPSGSMAPTLLSGDYFFAAKPDYGYSRYAFPFDLFSFRGRIFAHAPKRGDVVVFRHNGQDWVKRIVGLPGESVQLKGGRLYIDGRIVERREVEPEPGLFDGFDRPLIAPTYEELLPGGAVHRIVQLQGDDGPASNTDLLKIPQDSYFMLGDNRDNSMDSRMSEVGVVPFENLIGRAELIFYSRAGAPASPRFDRVGARVR